MGGLLNFVGMEGLSGGLVTDNAVLVGGTQMTIAENVLVSTSISRKKRGGQEDYFTGAAAAANGLEADEPIRGVIECWIYDNGEPTSDLFLHQGEKVYSIDTRNLAAVDRTGAITLADDGVPSYQMMNNKLYFCSTTSTDGYNKWDMEAQGDIEAAVTPVDGPGKYLCIHNGRMVMAGVTDFPYTVYLSESGNPESWTTGAGGTSFNLDLDGDPEGITGLASFQGRLYVWTRRSLYEISGYDAATFVVQTVSKGIGCLAHASIVTAQNDVFFASDRGYHSLRQAEAGKLTEALFESRDIQRMWTELLNTAFYKRTWARYFESINCIIITVPSSGQLKNDQVLVYNTLYKIWTVWPDLNARSLTQIMINNREQILLAKEDGTMALVNVAARTDFGNGYTFRFRTGVIYPTGKFNQCRFCSITVLASSNNPANFSVGWLVDGKIQGSYPLELTAGEDLLGVDFVLGQSALGVGQHVPHTVGIDETGYGIQIEIVSGGTSDLEFYGFILEVEDASPQYS